MIKLKDILNEDEVSNKFGNVAFGEDPVIAKMQGKKKEDNTTFEENLLQILSSWTITSSTELSNKLYNIFPILKKATKIFPAVLTPNTPNGTELYRGISKPNQKLIEKLEKSKKEDWTKEKIGTITFYRYSKPVRYTPHRKVQSWTSSKSVAPLFSGDDDGVILSTIQNEEFLFNQNLIKRIYPESNEQEIIHFGDKFKEKVYVMVSPYFWRELPSKDEK